MERLRPRRLDRLALSASAAALIAGAASCRAEQGMPYDCVCTYLTDFDDASKQEASVCAASPERAKAVAHGCAQLSAPAPIQDCACQPAKGGACPSGECRAK